jgi:hypothetical protein
MSKFLWEFPITPQLSPHIVSVMVRQVSKLLQQRQQDTHFINYHSSTRTNLLFSAIFNEETSVVGECKQRKKEFGAVSL